nr:MAG TPA: hypothetical protein [Caudoviricetes sp.]
MLCPLIVLMRLVHITPIDNTTDESSQNKN